MRKIYVLTITAFVLLGCSSKYKYWDISKFRISSDALQKDEEIKVIYTSQGPDNNKDMAYFIHLIVVSQKNGDTVNVLTTVNNGFEEDVGDEIFNFIDKNDAMAHLINHDLSGVTEVKELEKFEKINFESIKKVARDPKFDYLADNNYPSIIGYIGKVSGP